MKTLLLKSGLFVVVLTLISTGKLFAFTAVTDGDWTDPATWGGTAPSGNVSNQDITIPSGIDVNMNTNVTFSGLLNSFTVDGTLTSSTNSELSIQTGTFNGSGDVDIQRIVFTGLLVSYSFSGDMTVNTFVNSGSIIAFTSQVTVTDSLHLDDGTLTLNTGSNLMLNANAKVVRNNGSLATTGGVFNSGGAYHVHYIGGSKTTGIEINSMDMENADITLDDNASVLTMGSDLIIHGNLMLNTGTLNVGANDLEIHGNMDIQSGTALTTTAASNVTIETASSLSSGLVFTSGSSVDQFAINYTGSSGSVILKSSLSVAGELQLHNGTLSIESGAVLTMSAGSLVQVINGKLENGGGTFTGTASYDVEYLGDSTTTTGEEITGSGLNDVEVNLAEGEVMLDDDATVGGELSLVSGKLNLNSNNLVLNGTLDQESSSPIVGNMNSDLHLNITSAGNDTIYFDGSNSDLEQLIVDVTGGGDIVLGSGLHIHDELTMTSGSVRLMNDNLVVEQDANITGYSDTRYIVTPNAGKLQMYVPAFSSYVVFPVGTESSYSPASIQQVSTGTAGNFMVKTFNGLFTGGTENSGFNSATGGSVVNRTWLVESDAGTVNMNLKLGWMVTSEVNGFDRTNAYITHYTNNDWDTQVSGSATAGANSTYEISRSGITSLSPFAVADEDAELIVDENELLTIHLYPNPCTDVMNVTYASANNHPYTCQVTDVTGRVYEVARTGENQMDVSALSKGTYLLKMIDTETNKVSVRQFVKQ
ncbi:T9SS type A sorting domain-containing protein [Fluviicola chungangensis]|uniref:T9SS type A sorting domain-containing protein n=1 Tax=Fluviicola chungangensis TaxID=2597671 RepID=A0A556MNP6_9FLAO|nr:T9SS type A sorting domain-containing protein [Fluviicola chungangensis]TSJ41329.1 T9SS type A sorting domain-containing protein [Fluviicola chungangensis]